MIINIIEEINIHNSDNCCNTQVPWLVLLQVKSLIHVFTVMCCVYHTQMKTCLITFATWSKFAILRCLLVNYKQLNMYQQASTYCIIDSAIDLDYLSDLFVCYVNEICMFAWSVLWSVPWFTQDIILFDLMTYEYTP